MTVPSVDDQAWRTRAACRPGCGYDPDIWYPDPKDTSTQRLAERICRGCPVSTECLMAANAKREVFGIWGGHARNVRGGPAQPPGRPPAAGTGCGTVKGFRTHLQHDERPCQPCRDAANDAYAIKYAKSLQAGKRAQ